MMFEHLKERLQSVQQDFSSGFKTLGDKSKESKVTRKPRTCTEETSVRKSSITGEEGDEDEEERDEEESSDLELEEEVLPDATLDLS
uniref:Uncharacterized protein n=1 Tax=Knipowitschia caucasica TaxID=637954 RepID=A0AAV2MGA4_KNICA